jgi:thioredoxin-related protein
MAPMVHGLEAKYAGRIKFSYLDADDSRTRDFQRSLGFSYQPEFHLIDSEGKFLHKLVGYVRPEEFEAVFAEYLSP